MKNLKLTRNECPNTRAEFVRKWNSDASFRVKAELTGFKVICENVVFPNGKVADTRVK